MATKDRWFTCVTYANENAVKYMIQKQRNAIRAFAYIIHDKDETDTHIQIILRTYQPYAFKTILNWFRAAQIETGSEKIQNTFVQTIIDRYGIVNYLTHKDEPDKAQYDESQIVDGGLEQFYENDGTKDNSFEIITDLMENVSYYDMVKRYGREYIYHHDQYEKVAARIRAERKR